MGRRITIRRDGQVLNTKYLILAFSTPNLPQTVKMAYIRCPVRPYIPNPLLSFQCQRYGHSKNVCLGQTTCPRCGESGHVSADCPVLSDAPCPTWITEKEITAVKIKEKISYPEARHVVLSRTPVSGKSYAGAARKSTSNKCIQCTEGTDNSSDSATPTNPESDSPKRPKGRRARQRNQRPTLASIGKIEQDTLTGDCSEDDEAMMDIQSGPSTSSSGGGASAAL
ncbi:uncharacterized protein TNCV_797211 [Trichonephila clavipes]|uniref:CCHC-type domain-containing protein n=1 Tax=Trichonephila clavipes TaxID=2585209 RepID=A0A8X7BM29_TRICX|nr:uncharacterized protein TNCV_797211 [Trichonephila clavipes]